MSVPCKVTAVMAEPVINLHTDMMLDGPLSWAAYQRYRASGKPELAPIARDRAHDFDIPLDRWHQPPDVEVHATLLDADGYIWGWKTSTVITDTEPAMSGVAIRRRPATDAMARWSDAAKHHIGLGPMKARNVTYPAGFVPRLHWHVDTPDPDSVLNMLTEHVTHIGSSTAHGYGKVLTWHITTGPEGGWRHRHMPAATGPLRAVRAPNWHPTRLVPSQEPTHAAT